MLNDSSRAYSVTAFASSPNGSFSDRMPFIASFDIVSLKPKDSTVSMVFDVVISSSAIMSDMGVPSPETSFDMAASVPLIGSSMILFVSTASIGVNS